jgi:hypothetical protein
MSNILKEFNVKHGALIGTNNANYVQILGSASGNSVAINAQGTDTDISISLVPKGNGTVNIPLSSAIMPLGTPNGVLYLDSTKAITTGNNLTFSGTNLGIGITTPSTALEVNGDIKVSNTTETLTKTSTIDGWTYSGKSILVSAQETASRGLSFSTDGTKMYIVGQTTDTVYQYTLSTPFDVSTATYASKSFSILAQDGTSTSLYFKPDGLVFYMLGDSLDTVYQYTLSTAWDISTSAYSGGSFANTQETAPAGLGFSTDGTKMYIIGSNTDTVYQYTLSTAWDVQSATYSTKSFSVTLFDGTPSGIEFNNNGTKMYIVGSGYDCIIEYTLSTAWDVSTAVYTDRLLISLGISIIDPLTVLDATVTQDIYTDFTNNVAYILDSNTGRVYQYTTNTTPMKVSGNKLVVTPFTYFKNDIATLGSIRALGFIQATNAATFSSTVNVGSTLTASGSLVASSTITLSGSASSATTIGTAATTGTTTIGGTLQSGLITIGQSTGAQTLNIANGATLTATTKTVNIGANGVSGSTTNINIGSAVSGATSSTTNNGTLSVTGTLNATSTISLGGSTTSATNIGTSALTGTTTIGGTSQSGIITIGQSAVAQTLNIANGATLTATTKTVNIGANGASGSTTAINIGSAVNGATNNITVNGLTVVQSATSRVGIGIDSGGSITLGRQDGTASSPYIDFNTGATLVDYDTRIIATSGNGTAGNGTLGILTGAVGIGTSTPGAKLHIRQDQDGTTQTIIQNRNATGTPLSALTFISGAFDYADDRYAQIVSGGGSSNYLAFKVSNGATPSEKLRIASSGNILIGTSTDNSTGLLQVNGTITGTTLKSTVATGTAPFTVSSTTLVTNLNADTLDGYHASSFLTAETDTLQSVTGRGATSSVSTISLTAATASTTTGTGTLVVTGGVGIGGDTYVGGNLVVTGTITGSNPTSTIDLTPANTSGVQKGIRLYDAGTGSGEGLYIQWESASRSDAAQIYGVGDTTGGALVFKTNTSNTGTSTERMRIDSSGNLGLGVTPSAWYSGYKAFDVSAWGSVVGEFGTQGTITVVSNAYATSAGYDSWVYKNTAPASRYKQYDGQHQWYTAPSGTAGNAISFTQAMTLDASGNLGIGTSSPIAKLDIAGDLNVDYFSRKIGYLAGDSSHQGYIQPYDSNGFLNLYATFGTGGIRLFTGSGGGTERMRIDSSGNVGIGLSTPGALFDVYREIRVSYANSNQYRIRITDTDGNGRILVDGDTSSLIFGTSSAGTNATATERMRIDSSGNLGLGVIPSAWNSTWKAIEITSGAGYIGSGVVNAISIGQNNYVNAGGSYVYKTTNATTVYQQTAGQHQWYTAASGTAGNAISFTQTMTLDASGNLGIGTTTPGAKLEVNGTVRFPSVGTSGIIGLGASGALSSVTIGSGLSLTAGTLTASASVSVSDDTTTVATYYPVFSTTTSGAPTLKVSSTKLQFIPSTGTLYATIFQSLSDKSLKTNVESIVDPYAVLELEGVKYDWVDGSGTQYGFIAQDVEKIIPELVGFNGEYKSVNYNGIIPFLVETVKKQQSVIDSLIARIEKLENK